MSKMGLTTARIITRGKVFYSPYAEQNELESRRGLIFDLTKLHDFGVVTTADADGACASQGVTLNVPALINGALATDGVATFETPRNVVAAWTTAAIMTVTGTDQYGEVMVEASASGTSHTGTKAFKTITQVIFSATVTGATVGEGVVLGLPHLIALRGQIISTAEGGAVTFVAGDDTAATATTGDVRGTVAFADAPDGVRHYMAQLTIFDTDTIEGAYGVAQFKG